MRLAFLTVELDQDEHYYRDTESVARTPRWMIGNWPRGNRSAHGASCGQVNRYTKRVSATFRWTVVLRGEVEAFGSHAGREQILGNIGPCHFAGDVSALMGNAAVANFRVETLGSGHQNS